MTSGCCREGRGDYCCLLCPSLVVMVLLLVRGFKDGLFIVLGMMTSNRLLTDQHILGMRQLTTNAQATVVAGVSGGELEFHAS